MNKPMNELVQETPEEMAKQAVESALGQMLKPPASPKPQFAPDKNYAPPKQSSVREVIEELEATIKLLQGKVEILKLQMFGK